MKGSDLYLPATLAAEQVVKDHAISALPVDPISLACKLGIEIVAKPPSASGVSGMLIRHGNAFVIAYATHIKSIGFQNFSIAHELGHYFLAGHIDAVLADDDIHESCAGFSSGDRYEMEADHFAAALLMPRTLFMSAMQVAGEGLTAIKQLASLCRTSLTATAIQYARCTPDSLAIVLSSGNSIDYCFMSTSLQDLEGLTWIRKGELLSNGTATFAFNQSPERIRHSDRIEETCNLQAWFGGEYSLSATEQIIGLGSYGKTLTVLYGPDIDEQVERIEEEEDLINSWRPRFRRR